MKNEDLNTIADGVIAGDKELFRRIIEACNAPLYRTALAILRNEQDAEDAMQSAYLKAYVHLHSFRKEASFLTWITRILINECKMMLRKRRKNIPIGDEEIVQRPTGNGDATDMLHSEQLGKLLERALVQLPEKYRIVYIVREVNELSTEMTAAALGITAENVKIRLHRAKSMLREDLLRRASTAELFPFHRARCSAMAERVMKSISAIRGAVPPASAPDRV